MKNKLRPAILPSFVLSQAGRITTRRRTGFRGDKLANILTKFSGLALGLLLLFQVFDLVAPVSAQRSVMGKEGAGGPPPQAGAGKTYTPTKRQVIAATPVNMAVLAAQEAFAPTFVGPSEIRAIHPPAAPPRGNRGVPILTGGQGSKVTLRPGDEEAPPPSPTGSSPGPTRTFKGQELLGLTIPPDTGGAVGTTHVVTVTNDRMRIHDRNGVVISTVTLSGFWAGVVLEGGAIVNAFDPKMVFDRFNNRYIFVSSANPQVLSSAALIAVSATADPTGTWFRYSIDADPTATAATGKWIDYPTIGFNRNWLVLMENEFNYGAAGAGYWGPALFVIEKALIYTGPLSFTTSVFEESFATGCVGPVFETQLGCGFTMAPAITEDNTTDTEYLVEDWDNVAAQLRLSKITGTPSAPVLTIGTQFPQSANSWQFNAGITPSGSGGYAIQKQQNAYLLSNARAAVNDSRIQNSVFRNGSLWTTHTAIVSTVPQPAGVATSAASPHNHTAVQWWQINPTIETGLSTLPLQRARIEDPTADNCNNNAGGIRAGCTTPQGQFFAFPHISVNMTDDVLIGYTRFSNLTYASAAYSLRRSADPPNTMRDSVVFRSGQSNYSIGAGAPFTIRWGDMSHAQTDPLNDTDFWTTQEYADVQRDVGIGIAGTWSTWWALVSPSTPAASTSGNLIISEFRLRGPQGVRDEFVELYNPGASPLLVTTTDGSDGWALVYSADGIAATGVATIPVGTVIPAKGHYLITDNQTSTVGPTVVYSLLGYPNTAFRDSGGDGGYSLDNADNGGFAVFKSSIAANWTASNRADSVGFATIAPGLFREGTGIPNITGAPTGQISFHRSQVGGPPQDTGDNAADFIFTDTVSELLGRTPRLGAPGPENLDGPVLNTNVFVDRFDPNFGTNSPPNRFRDLTPVTNGALGTLSFRRKVQNLTGQPVTRLRFRIKQISTLNSPVAFGTADLRALSSGMIVVDGQPVEGTLVEEPPTQVPPTLALGGGWNTSWSLALPAPLAPNATINVQYVVGVQIGGSFSIFINVEALP